MTTFYSGIDLHSNNSVVVVMDDGGKVVYRRRLANELARIAAALAPYGEGLSGVVVESTYNWYWLVDGLMAAGYRVHWRTPRRRNRTAGSSTRTMSQMRSGWQRCCAWAFSVVRQNSVCSVLSAESRAYRNWFEPGSCHRGIRRACSRDALCPQIAVLVRSLPNAVSPSPDPGEPCPAPAARHCGSEWPASETGRGRSGLLDRPPAGLD